MIDTRLVQRFERTLEDSEQPRNESSEEMHALGRQKWRRCRSAYRRRLPVYTRHNRDFY